jgi:diguanylate cyclase (GGDEF)-like protein
MRGAKNLQSEVENLVLATANPADALRELAELLCKRTRSKLALVAHFEDEERGATLLAHPGLSAANANTYCAALAPYRAACLRTGKPFTVASLDPVVLAAIPDELRAMKLDKLLVVPLYKAGKPLGLLVIARRTTNFGALDVRNVEPLRTTLVLLIEQMDYLEKISVYSNFANFDGLTGLYNHRYFQEALAKEIARAQRLGYPVSLMLIDIDRFKQYNDNFGHPHGDIALKEIAGVLKRSIRTYDLAARYGGEELVLVLPQVTPHRVTPMAERIRTAVAELPFRGASESHHVQLTVSIGVAGLPANAKSKSELIKRADQALYLAKEEGRNRVLVSLIRSRKSIRFAYCPPAFTSSYYVDILTGVRDVIEQVGGIELIARAPEKESDQRELSRICRSLVKSGVDAIALAPQSDAILPIVRVLNNAHIPVFFFNVPRRIESAQVVSYIGYQQKEAGREVGRYLARVLRGGGSVLVLKGLNDTSSLLRVAGFRDELVRYPRIRVVATRQAGWERDKARRVVERTLKEHSLDAIYAVSDEMALGASDAVAAAGRRGEIFVIGLDGTRAALQGIREGALTATLNTNPGEMGRILMRTVVRGLNRHEHVEPEILSPINIVDLENVSQY